MSSFIFILILIIIFFYLVQDLLTEMFSASYQTFQSYIPINGYKYPMYPLTNSPANWFYNFFPIMNGYTNLPWNNMALGTTSNMSYDLRGDPLVIPRTNFVWNNSSTVPIYNPPI
jgi:hypothetical protein